jgi:hypothetical protein
MLIVRRPEAVLAIRAVGMNRFVNKNRQRERQRVSL